MKKKFKLINGWTKETVLAQVKKYNNGTKALKGTRCAYLTVDDNRCAVGCFIPNDHEALSSVLDARTTVENYGLELFMPFGDGLVEFQLVHDQDRSDSDNVYENIENFLNERVE